MIFGDVCGPFLVPKKNILALFTPTLDTRIFKAPVVRTANDVVRHDLFPVARRKAHASRAGTHGRLGQLQILGNTLAALPGKPPARQFEIEVVVPRDALPGSFGAIGGRQPGPVGMCVLR